MPLRNAGCMHPDAANIGVALRLPLPSHLQHQRLMRTLARCRNALPVFWRHLRIFCGALPLAACLGSGDETRSQPATLIDLGFLAGYAASQASAMSSDGTVVVGTATTAAGNRQAFRWTAQRGMVGLGFLPDGGSSIATAVSADGGVVIGNGDATSSGAPTPAAAFRWTAEHGMQRIDALPGSYLCSAGGVSGDGSVVVGTCLQFNNTAFRWTADAGSTSLGRFGGGSDQQSTAVAIARDASIIAGAGHPVLTGAVMWSASGTATILGKLPGDATGTATAVAADGSVIVGVSTDAAGTAHAFRWTSQTGMVALGNAGDGLPSSIGAAVSSSGRVVVGWAPAASGDVALIWDADHGMRTLDAALAADYDTRFSGWVLSRATAISEDARTIAGYGIDPQGQTRAWIVRLAE